MHSPSRKSARRVAAERVSDVPDELTGARHKPAKQPEQWHIRDVFHIFAHQTARMVGSAWAFAIAVLVIVTWAATGPVFGYSDTWQLIINTGTTIVTFLIVFLIQNTQNRDGRALHLKLDELLRAIAKARTNLVDLESLSESELDQLEAEFKRVRDLACTEVERRH
jgi:low affinity Fe/Cu permease